MTQLANSKPTVFVVDDDQGKSGSQANSRSGFGRVVTAVGMGEVGIVLSLEVCRRVLGWGAARRTRCNSSRLSSSHSTSSPASRPIAAASGMTTEPSSE